MLPGSRGRDAAEPWGQAGVTVCPKWSPSTARGADRRGVAPGRSAQGWSNSLHFGVGRLCAHLCQPFRMQVSKKIGWRHKGLTWERVYNLCLWVNVCIIHHTRLCLFCIFSSHLCRRCTGRQCASSFTADPLRPQWGYRVGDFALAAWRDFHIHCCLSPLFIYLLSLLHCLSVCTSFSSTPLYILLICLLTFPLRDTSHLACWGCWPCVPLSSFGYNTDQSMLSQVFTLSDVNKESTAEVKTSYAYGGLLHMIYLSKDVEVVSLSTRVNCYCRLAHIRHPHSIMQSLNM